MGYHHRCRLGPLHDASGATPSAAKGRRHLARVSWPAARKDLEARLLLPVSPGSPPPGEKLLLAYYQGRIAPEDIYPPPPDENNTPAEPPIPHNASESEVDTSRIQSYQIREFVEALQICLTSTG